MYNSFEGEQGQVQGKTKNIYSDVHCFDVGQDQIGEDGSLKSTFSMLMTYRKKIPMLQLWKMIIANVNRILIIRII
jgi:hypothetical protein